MKRLVIVLLAGLVVCGNARAQNLFANPGFEDGTTGWVNFWAQTGSFSAERFHSGKSSARISHPASKESGWSQSEIKGLEAGALYKVQVYAYRDVDTVSAKVWLFTGSWPTGAPRQQGATGEPTREVNTWELLTGEIPANPDGTIGLNLSVAGKGNVWFDDVSLTMVKTKDERKAELSAVTTSATAAAEEKAQAHLDLGQIALWADKDFTAALANYRKVLALVPTDQTKCIIAYANLAEIYQQQKDVANALASYNKLLDLDPADKAGQAVYIGRQQVLRTVAEIYRQQKDYANALASYNRLRELVSQDKAESRKVSLAIAKMYVEGAGHVWFDDAYLALAKTNDKRKTELAAITTSSTATAEEKAKAHLELQQIDSKTKDPGAPPFHYLWSQAYHILPETHNSESGYFSLCEGLNGKIYVGTAKYGVNSYLVEFDPKTEKQRIVIDTRKLCRLNPPASWNEAQSKIHTRNFVGPSGKIYVGSMGNLKKDDPGKYPGGYLMTYDPKTDAAECLGMPCPGYGIIDVVADEGHGIIYVVLDESGMAGTTKPWMRYDVKTRKFSELGPLLTSRATTLIDRRGYANVITRDYQLAQYDPDTGKVTLRNLVVDGKKWEPGSPPDWAFWKLGPDGRTAYLIQMTDATLYAIDLLSEDRTVKAVSHGKMTAGKNVDTRSSLSIGPDGRVYAAIRTDNETGFGAGHLQHLVRFDPTAGKMEDLGVLTVKNPDFFHVPGADFPGPPYYGYQSLPDGTLIPSLNHMGIVVTRGGTIYVTMLYPFTLLRIQEY